MKLIKSFLPISILTFLAGCLSVWLISLIPNPSTPLAILNDSQVVTHIESIQTSQQKFTVTTQACGFGDSWMTGYKTNDGQILSQSRTSFDSSNEARIELKKKIKNALRIDENSPNYKGFVHVGERIILINPPDKDGKKIVSILNYDGRKSISSINAPSLELALEFELEH